MKINLVQFKQDLTIDQVFSYIEYLGGEPKMMDGFFISRTICHNPPHTGSHKLYYYDNSKLFTCYTECGDSVDIYNLTQRVKKNEGLDWTLGQCINFVFSFFNILNEDFDFYDTTKELLDWQILNKTQSKQNHSSITSNSLTIYNSQILSSLPQLRIIPWEQEGISYEIIKQKQIRYNPATPGIIIPHYDENNNLIGIRERTLIKEHELLYGKYRPAILLGQMYNHPLSFSLYNLNWSKDNIKKMKTAIVFESEKSCMQYASMFGIENDISVACCGSAFTFYQLQLLLNLGVQNIIIGFDKQFQTIGDKEFKQWTKKLKKLHTKYSPYVNISFLFDKHNNILNYKDSPTDQGKEKFLLLLKEKITL